jgi:hypothetical protein
LTTIIVSRLSNTIRREGGCEDSGAEASCQGFSGTQVPVPNSVVNQNNLGGKCCSALCDVFVQGSWPVGLEVVEKLESNSSPMKVARSVAQRTASLCPIEDQEVSVPPPGLKFNFL